jgi:ribosome-associated protein
MNEVILRGDHITLAQALKAAGLAGSGGQAKSLVRAGQVRVNGTTVLQPGRKLRAGDQFQVEDGTPCTVSR